MYNMLSPGVQVNEIDFSDYVVATSQTTIGLVGGARRGPTIPTMIASQEDFIRYYGTPSPNEYGALSAIEVLSESQRLIYQRVVHLDTNSTAGNPNGDKVLFTSKEAGTMLNGAKLTVEVNSGTTGLALQKPSGTRIARDIHNIGGTLDVSVDDTTQEISFLGEIQLYPANVDLKWTTAANRVGVEIMAPPDIDLSRMWYSIGISGTKVYFNDLSTEEKTRRAITAYVEVTAAGQAFDIYYSWNGSVQGFARVKVDAASTLGTTEFVGDPTDDTSGGVTAPDYTTLEEFSNLSLTPSSDQYIEAVVNEQSDYMTAQVQDQGTWESKDLFFANGTAGATYATAGDASTTFTIKSRWFDSTLNGCTVEFSEPDISGYFNMFLYDADHKVVLEKINDLNLDENDSHYVVTVINENSINIQIEYNPLSDMPVDENVYTLTGGSDGIEGLTAEDIIGTVDTNEGMQAFANPEVLDLGLLAAPGWYDAKVVNAGITLCQNRGECFYITCTPDGLTAKQANDWTNGSGEFVADHDLYDTSYAGIFWPWVQVYNSYSKKNVWIPPEGPVLAQYAYSDRSSQQWFAAAGLNRGVMKRVLSVRYNATKDERDLIYGNRNCVNPIINYRGQGIVIWGQKTLQRRPTALDRINVRRLLCYLKKIISASTDYFVFEPNDEYSWNKWMDMVEPKMDKVMQLRGVYEYYIRMRPTARDIENNAMPGVIAFKPTKTAEYIPLDFMIAPYSATFDELGITANSTATQL